MTSIIRARNRRGDRVAECAGLENRCTARYRGFKSHPLRLVSKALIECQKDAISCTGNGLRLVVSGNSEDVEDAPIFNRSQPESAVRSKKCDKKSQQNWPGHPRRSMRFDEQFRTARRCPNISASR
jgi:hypothetical protein